MPRRSSRRKRKFKWTPEGRRTAYIVGSVCALLALGFAIGMRYAATRNQGAASRAPAQYLDETWNKTTKRYEQPRRPVVPKEGRSEVARVSIVIDDLGPNMKHARRLMDLDPAITLAVIPWQTFSREIVAAAADSGNEVILHQPMEARHNEGAGMPGMLYLRMTDQEIRDTFRANLDAHSGVSGINNHMGSAFTEDERALGAVFHVLREYGLYFLDSRTSVQTTGRKLGRMYDIPVFERDVFLDNESDYDYMAGMWERFMNRARRDGFAVLIAHGRTDSIEFLEVRLPDLKEKKFRLVPVSLLYDGGPDA